MLHATRLGDVVPGCKSDIIAAGFIDNFTYMSPNTNIEVITTSDHFMWAMIFFYYILHDLECPIRRAIVENDDLLRLVSLRKCSYNYLPDILLLVIGKQCECNPRALLYFFLRHFSLLIGQPSLAYA